MKMGVLKTTAELTGFQEATIEAGEVSGSRIAAAGWTTVGIRLHAIGAVDSAGKDRVPIAVGRWGTLTHGAAVIIGSVPIGAVKLTGDGFALGRFSTRADGTAVIIRLEAMLAIQLAGHRFALGRFGT